MASPFDNISFSAGGYSASDDHDMFDFDQGYGNSFTAVNQSSSGRQTVSPQEILMSAPGSAQMGYLDTPESGFLDSPAMGSSLYNTTPLEDGSLDSQLNFDELKNLPPLFTDVDQFSHIPRDPKMEFSPALSHAQPAVAPPSPMVRQKSSPGRPPIPTNIHARKHSLNAGVTKPPKPRKTLPEIEVNSEDDKETAKRKKNTAAARKSRQRKAEDMEYLMTENQRLRAIIEAMGGSPDV